MRSAASGRCGSPRVTVASRWRSQDARRIVQPRRASTDPRVGLKAGLPRRRRRRAQHGAAGESAEARGLLRSDDAGRRGVSARNRRRRRGAPGTPARQRRRPRPEQAPRPPRTRRRRSRAAAASPTPISPSAATTSSSATTTASTPTTSRTRAGRACSPRSCAPAARATCRSTATCCSCRSSRRAAASIAALQGVTTPVSAERFRGVRIFDISDLKKPKQVAADADLPRIAHAHAGDRSEGQGEHLRLRVGHRRGALGRGARGLRRPGSQGGSEHRALQHRRDQGAAGRAGEGARSSTARASSPIPKTGAHRGPVAGRRSRAGHADARA